MAPEFEDDIPFADSPPVDPNAPKPDCETCGDHKFVGGLVRWGDGEVDSVCDPCPDCNCGENDAHRNDEIPKSPNR